MCAALSCAVDEVLVQKRQEVKETGGAHLRRRATRRSSLGSPDDSKGAAETSVSSSSAGEGAVEVEGTGEASSMATSAVEEEGVSRSATWTSAEGEETCTSLARRKTVSLCFLDNMWVF